ncbi:hypothetical protein ZEAMMB73_Zm00001d006514 [Zea mays]|uniref:Uncharacterized protein n=1 Tax=Zea mays TaxID=4577 RepID=A0A1D6EXE3_MAIZE|nr:hypothetical protein ZEAMMB73_Zm00001d006514 [Zea mays]
MVTCFSCSSAICLEILQVLSTTNFINIINNCFENLASSIYDSMSLCDSHGIFFFLAFPFSGQFLPVQLLCCLHRCTVLCLQPLHLLFLLLPLEPSVRIGPD